MHVVNSHVGSLLFAVVIAASTGCLGSSPEGPADPSLGSISINLVGQAPSGAIYRLRNAVITVTGPTARTWNTEDDPNQTTMSADVDPGTYTASVQTGWTLERVVGGTATPVPAQLVSDNPVQFAVAAAVRTSVPLRFHVDAVDIDLSQGYDIVVTIQEPPVPQVFVTNRANGNTPSITVYSSIGDGDSDSLRVIVGALSKLSSPLGVTVAGDQIIVADQSVNAIDFFPIAATGNVAPTKQITGSATTLSSPTGVTVFNGELYVMQSNNAIVIFPLSATGNVAPARTIRGTSFAPFVTIDSGELYAPFNVSATRSDVSVYLVGGSGNLPPVRTINGPVLTTSCITGVGIERNELFVADTCAGQIRVYAKGTNGTAMPLRVISTTGNGIKRSTQMTLFQGEIYLTDSVASSVQVFPASASGSVAPSRTISGGHTNLNQPFGIAVH